MAANRHIKAWKVRLLDGALSKMTYDELVVDVEPEKDQSDCLNVFAIDAHLGRPGIHTPRHLATLLQRGMSSSPLFDLSESFVEP